MGRLDTLLATAAMVLGCIVGLCLPAAAQERWSGITAPVFRHLNFEDGLPGSVVTVSHQDAAGFMWFGTQAGLARWDGYRMRVFQPTPGREGGLPDVLVRALHGDRQGRLWIGTASGGLVCFDPATDRFDNIDGLSHGQVQAIAADGEAGLWVGSAGGLDRVELATGEVRRAVVRGLPAAPVNALQVARDGSLWIATSRGLYQARGGAVQGAPLLAEMSVETLLQSSDGQLWAGTRLHGLFQVTAQSARAVAALHPITSGGKAAAITSLAEPVPGQVWIATFGTGLFMVGLDGQLLRNVRAAPAVGASLAHNTVRHLYTDRGGLLWAATSLGVSRHDPRRDAIITAFSDLPAPAGFSDRILSSLLELPGGEVWVGTPQSGVDRVDPTRGRIGTVLASGAATLQGEPVASLAYGPDHMVYIGGRSNLYRARADGSGLERITIAGREPGAANDTIIADGDMLWLGGRDDGLWRLLPGGKVRAERPPFAAQLGEVRVSNLLRSGPGTLWVGTRRGLFRADLASNRVTPIRLPGADPLPFGSLISSMLVDVRGRLWVATYGAGILLLEGLERSDAPVVVRLNTDSGLPNNNVDKLLQDRAGMIWAATGKGLVRVDPETLAIKTLQSPQGLAINTHWSGAGLATRAGELIFGGAGGLTIVRPERLRDIHYRPPVAVSELQIDGAVQHFSPLQSSTPVALPVGGGSLQVEFAALDFLLPQRLRYAYRLEGFDERWTEADASRRVATYAKLPPGDYTLQARASDSEGQWGEIAVQLPVHVPAAWYQSAWWDALMAIAAGTLVIVVFKTRTALLERRKRELEAEVAQRTEQLRAQQAALTDANASLQHLNAELTLSADTLRELGDVGCDITATLDMDAVFAALASHAGAMLAIPCFAAYRVAPDGAQLVFAYGVGGERAPHAFAAGDRHPVAQAARDKQPVTPQAPLEVVGFPLLRSAQVLPLVADEQVLAVLVLGAPEPRVFDQRTHLIIRSLCAYGAIGLANAQALAALRSAQSQLARQEKMLAMGGLVAGAAHQINTPLGVAISALSGIELTQQKLQQAVADQRLTRSVLERCLGDGRDYLQLAWQGVRRSAALIDSLKHLVKPSAEEKLVTLDLARVLTDVMPVFQQELERHGHRLLLQVPPQLPAPAAGDVLLEILGAVIRNCIDHAFAERQGGTVQVMAMRAGSRVRIVIEDDGVGIAADILPRVCEPFFTTQGGSGKHAGLGLHIAYHYATARLGGTLEVESRPGQGTSVVLSW